MKIKFLQDRTIANVLLPGNLNQIAGHLNQSLRSSPEDIQHFVVVDLEEQCKLILTGTLRNKASRNQVLVLIELQ